jgi:hypothetical protein
MRCSRRGGTLSLFQALLPGAADLSSLTYSPKEVTLSEHSITLERKGVQGFMSTQSIGTDALNALLTIPGVEDPEIISESDDPTIRSNSHTHGLARKNSGVLMIIY